MATAVDIGQRASPAGGPHVQNKQEVARRLFLAYSDLAAGSFDGRFRTLGYRDLYVIHRDRTRNFTRQHDANPFHVTPDYIRMLQSF
jgi:hypothetical protein